MHKWLIKMETSGRGCEESNCQTILNITVFLTVYSKIFRMQSCRRLVDKNIKSIKSDCILLYFNS